MKRLITAAALGIIFVMLPGCGITNIGNPGESHRPGLSAAVSLTPGAVLTTMGVTITPPVNTTAVVSASPTATPTAQTVTAGVTDTLAPTFTPSPSPTATKKPTPTPTVTPEATPTEERTPHPTPVVTPGPLFNELVNPQGDTVETRFAVPEGFERVPVADGSFAQWLRNLRLKEDGLQLHYIDRYGNPDGVVPADIYSTPQAHAAILEMQMLSWHEQCADTIIHLWSEYLYSQQRYDEISFTFSDGFVCDFIHYTQGYRYSGGKWVYNADNWTGTGRNVFELYLKHVFIQANTWSMYQFDLDAVDINDMQIGDMFIIPRSSQGGHVVLICDMIKNPDTGEVRFMTLQGSLPAVEAHIMMNAQEAEFSPWQSIKDGVFTSATYWSCPVENLRRFK